MTNKKQHLRIDRRSVRVSTDFACRVGSNPAQTRNASVMNLSTGGLKFSCGHALILQILPPDQQTPGQISDVEIDVEFTLPEAGMTAAKILTHARIVHSERLAQDLYHVGIEFLEPVGAILEQWINDRLREQEAADRESAGG